MIKKLLSFFRVNREFEEQNKLLQNINTILQGEVNILREWNARLQRDKDKLEDVIFRKFGLSQSTTNEPELSGLEPVRKTKNWREVQEKLENATKKPDPVLTEQEKHWKEKLKNESI